MTFDDMLRDGSSFGKLTVHANLCYLNVSFSLSLVVFKNRGWFIDFAVYWLSCLLTLQTTNFLLAVYHLRNMTTKPLNTNLNPSVLGYQSIAVFHLIHGKNAPGMFVEHLPRKLQFLKRIFSFFPNQTTSRKLLREKENALESINYTQGSCFIAARESQLDSNL